MYPPFCVNQKPVRRVGHVCSCSPRACMHTNARACRYHLQVPRSRVAATATHRTGPSRPILAMGSGHHPSSQAPQSICERSALGKVKDTAQGSRRKIRLHQRFPHLTAKCVTLYLLYMALRVPLVGNLTAIDPAAAASETTYIVTQVSFETSHLVLCLSLLRIFGFFFLSFFFFVETRCRSSWMASYLV